MPQRPLQLRWTNIDLNVASISAPSFISAKAADVILSDVRPTSITPDALRSVNILLDELLWIILAHARSFETSRLKSGVLKAIPTQLGKDAILEAEIEIRAYRDKTQGRPRGPRPSDDANATFPLQEAFDVRTCFREPNAPRVPDSSSSSRHDRSSSGPGFTFLHFI